MPGLTHHLRVWDGVGLLGCPFPSRNELRSTFFVSSSQDNECGSVDKTIIPRPTLWLAARSPYLVLPRASSFRPSPASRPLFSRKSNKPSKRRVLVTFVSPGIDPWAPSVDSQSIASSLFALSLLPYLGFLYHLTKSKTAPGLTLFGFYFLLAFVGATIPAGIYAKVHYGTSLSNVDWLHGTAESLLTLTNLFIVIGLQRALSREKPPQTPQ